MTRTTRPHAGAERAGPPVDLIRIGDRLLLLASLPGVRAPDLRVYLVGDRQISIEGTVEYRHPVPRESLALSERAYGPFSRSIHLPLPVDPGRVSVTFRDGVLTVDLPIRAQPVHLEWQPKEGRADG